jgi:hypothetical protein
MATRQSVVINFQEASGDLEDQEIKYAKQEIDSLSGKRESEGAYPEVRVTNILGV